MIFYISPKFFLRLPQNLDFDTHWLNPIEGGQGKGYKRIGEETLIFERHFLSLKVWKL